MGWGKSRFYSWEYVQHDFYCIIIYSLCIIFRTNNYKTTFIPPCTFKGNKHSQVRKVSKNTLLFIIPEKNIFNRKNILWLIEKIKNKILRVSMLYYEKFTMYTQRDLICTELQMVNVNGMEQNGKVILRKYRFVQIFERRIYTPPCEIYKYQKGKEL